MLNSYLDITDVSYRHMTSNNPSILVLKCISPPREIIPALVEWWLKLSKGDSHFRQAGISQIESAHIENSSVMFSPYVSALADREKAPQKQLTSPWTIAIFIDNKEPAQTMILSTSTKTGTIVYLAEDAKGNPIIDPETGDFQEETMHSGNILIYCCLPILTTKQHKKAIDAGWCSETPLESIL